MPISILLKKKKLYKKTLVEENGKKILCLPVKFLQGELRRLKSRE